MTAKNTPQVGNRAPWHSADSIPYPAEKHFGGANDIPWRLTGILERLVTDAHQTERALIEQNALIAIFIGMTAIESFTNIYCRVVAEEKEFAAGRRILLQMLQDRRCYTGQKLLTLAEKIFKRPIDQADQRWVAFENLRKIRNEFIHFKSSHETVKVSAHVTIAGVVDTGAFAALDNNTPRWAMNCVRGIVELVGHARGLLRDQLPAFIHGWLGLVDIKSRYTD